MKTPTRYTADYSSRVIQDVDGPYVKFTDYTALQEQNARLREQLAQKLLKLGLRHAFFKEAMEHSACKCEECKGIRLALQQNGGKA